MPFENPFLDQLGNGTMPEAKSLGRCRLGNPGPLLQGSTILGLSEQADFAAEMPGCIMLDKVVAQGHGGCGISQLLQLGGVAQERAKPAAHAGGGRLVLVDLLEYIQKGREALRPVAEISAAASQATASA